MYTCIIHIWLVVPSSNLIEVMGGPHPSSIGILCSYITFWLGICSF